MSETLRILKVTEAYFPFLHKGGPAVKVRSIARRLAARGYRVTVLTADLGFTADDLRAANARCGPRGWQAEQDGVEAIFLRTRARYRTLTLNPTLLSFCRQRLREFDLVHIYGLYDLLGAGVAFYCRRWGVPYVIEPMGMFRPIVRNIRLKQLYHRLFGRRMLAGASRLIATAQQERHELVAGGVPDASVVVRRNGIDLPERFPPPGAFRHQWKIPEAARVVLFLGRLVSKKSPDLIVEAFAQWRAQTSRSQQAVLVLAGPDEGDGFRPRLEALAARRGVQSDVLFTGPLYDDAKWAAYRDADVFVLPSLNENFGNTAAEAVACGTPVILSDRCGIAPLVDQRAGLVVPHDREALQQALGQLLENELLRQRLRSGCAEVVAELSWQEPINAMEALYAEVLAESKRQ